MLSSCLKGDYFSCGEKGLELEYLPWLLPLVLTPLENTPGWWFSSLVMW